MLVRLFLAGLWAGLGLLCPSAALAQTPAAPPMVALPPAALGSLNLEQALTLARQQRTDFRNYSVDEQLAAQRTRQEQAAFRPQLNASADVRANTQRQVIVLPGFAPGEGERALRSGQPYQLGAGVTLTQKLYDPTRRPLLAQRRLDEQVAANATAQARIDLTETVSSAYYAALLYQAKLDFAGQDVARAESAYRDAQTRMAQQQALKTEVSQARFNLDNACLAQERAAADLRTAQVNLLSQLGDPTPERTPVSLGQSLAQLTGELTAPPAPEGVDTVATRRVEYRAEQLREQLARAAEQQNRRRYLPSADLVGYFGTQAFRERFDFYDFNQRYYGYSYVALQLNLPLFDGGSKRAQIQQNRLTAQRSRNAQTSLRRTVAYELTDARTQLDLSRRNAALQQQNLAVAEEALTVAQVRRRNGLVLEQEVVTARTTLSQARRDYLQALNDWLVDRLEYQRVTGQLK
ncbi:TolC family protein [Hymenobacter sp. BT664]|uniref:TolC family protein n=1 Tax=Hymenobacter montanus TaxID=2771359 RepID=A0A927GL44_9BACT|nr:TolC family protein [Hymenobacter montanus]MBD2769796.1 TolC family protein [Hymenobacter montanus]